MYFQLLLSPLSSKEFSWRYLATDNPKWETHKRTLCLTSKLSSCKNLENCERLISNEPIVRISEETTVEMYFQLLQSPLSSKEFSLRNLANDHKINNIEICGEARKPTSIVCALRCNRIEGIIRTACTEQTKKCEIKKNTLHMHVQRHLKCTPFGGKKTLNKLDRTIEFLLH